ncbi:MAG: DNA alkylation repair protein [Acidobacteriota bacterium]
MNFDQALKQLEAAGTAQNRKVYARHGVKDPQFGVSLAHLGKLTRAIGTNQEIADKLWATGNHDAQVLATMVADPQRFGLRDLDGLCRKIGNYVLADAFSKLVARSPHARRKAEVWTRSKSDFVGQVGFNVLAGLALSVPQDDPDLDDAYFEGHLVKIEEEIHQRPNRTRHAMNQALIAIGVRNPNLTTKALAAAGRIGGVDVDHGETSCKTPNASDYIRKTLEYRRAKARKKKTKARARS